jgi:hypothetical protein
VQDFVIRVKMGLILFMLEFFRNVLCSKIEFLTIGDINIEKVKYFDDDIEFGFGDGVHRIGTRGCDRTGFCAYFQ